MKHLAALILLGNIAMAMADTPLLPSEATVAQILRNAPSVRAAAAHLNAEEAQRQRLDSGPHEWSLRVGGQQRKTLPANAADQHFNEWNAALERPIRLPGKAALDRALGSSGVAIASTGLGDARHETSRALLKAWFDWLRERASSTQWQAQVGLLKQQDQAVERRLQLGDAARLERKQAAAALAQAEAQLSQAHARLRIAEETLQRRFPGLPRQASETLPAPQAITGKAEDWIAAILAHSHERQVSEGEAQRASLLAQRLRQDQLPDPSVGLQFSRERAGEEKVLGAYISIPLPGGARRAQAASGLAQAEASAAQADAVRQRITSEAASLYQSALAAYPTWQASELAAEQQGQTAEMTARAYRLGEGNLNDVLAARRLANEARLNALQAHLDALESRYRLLLDSHQLWDFDEMNDPSPTTEH